MSYNREEIKEIISDGEITLVYNYMINILIFLKLSLNSFNSHIRFFHFRKLLIKYEFLRILYVITFEDFEKLSNINKV